MTVQLKLHLSMLQGLNSSITKLETLTICPQQTLFQHTLRAAYQAGHVWGQALVTCPDLPEPSQWGWMKKENSWAPLWTTMPPISKGLKDLVTCQCKKVCKPPCKCYMADVKCSTLCFCRGNCFRKWTYPRNVFSLQRWLPDAKNIAYKSIFKNWNAR